MSLIDVLNEWAIAVTGVFGSAVVAASGVVRANARRSKRNERRLEGDPDDPNNRGVMDIVADNNDKLDKLESRMDEQHRALMDTVEELSDG